MNWAIKIISKALMTKISHISWGVTIKAFTVDSSKIYNNDILHKKYILWNIKC